MAASRAAVADIDVRVRRSVDDLSRLDVTRLRRAFRAMMATEGDRGYQHWAGIHGLPLPIYGRHANLSFLPWNRVYLARFEAALSRFEPGVTLPWWDWTRSNAIPEAFTQAEVDDRPNPLFAAAIDSSGWQQEGDPPPTETSRSPGPPNRLPSQTQVEDALAATTFSQFSQSLESLHNVVHLWVGGSNGGIPYAFYDPFCWVYQASIDRIWWLWQGRNPVPPDREIRNVDLEPFDTTVGQSWDATRFGYAYADPRSRTLTALAAGAASDRPTVADQLNFSDYAQVFAEIIAADETTPPLTIGIYGSWGIGKSSLLEMIAAQFADPDAGATPVHVVAFNAWEYNASEKIWPALVRRVMEEMERRAQWSRRARLWDTLKRNLSREWRRRRLPLAVAAVSTLAVALVAAVELDFDASVILAALAALGVTGLTKVVSDVATHPVSRWVAKLLERDGYGEELPYMREIRADLAFLVAQMRRDGQQSRILITIDDLDRCEPEKAVEVLQAVNQLLDFDAFVVCLGIDARVITAAVEAHYQQLLGSAGASGYEYLDKIIQIPFRIPTPTAGEIEAFLSAQMPIRLEIPEVKVAPVQSQADGGVASDFGEPLDELEANGAGGPHVAQSLPTTSFDQSELEGFYAMAPFLHSNPRHIKRLINVFRMVRTLAIRRGATELLGNNSQTIAWIVICAQWPYTVAGMLRAFGPLVEAAEGGEPYPSGEPLTVLHEACKGDLDEALVGKLDGDGDDLRQLLKSTRITWEQLRALQAYTVNFNPAIEEALHRGRPSGSTAGGQPLPLNA